MMASCYGPLHDCQVVLDGNAPAVDVQCGQRSGAGDLHRFAIEAYGQSLPQRVWQPERSKQLLERGPSVLREVRWQGRVARRA